MSVFKREQEKNRESLLKLTSRRVIFSLSRKVGDYLPGSGVSSETTKKIVREA